MSDRPPRVLLVDDEPHVLDALRALLEARGYAVSSARSGTAAVEAFAAVQPDVVLLDLGLPGLPGVEVCRRLRAESAVPILVVSARTDEREKVAALDAGADDYVTKPFSTEEFLARVRSALRRRQAPGAEEPVVAAGRIVIDRTARRVTVDGRDVHLTPTEYALLLALATNPDRVLTHRHLLATVMGPGYDDALDNLRTFVAQLRRKIERDPTRPRHVVTEPGIGYRFRPDPR